MELNSFIGKTVISTSTHNRYVIEKITSPYIGVRSEKPNSSGCHSHYRFECINGDPITNGHLVFEDQSLTEPFKEAYNAYCHSKDAYCEEIGYWMKKD
jgi:hypothetical protein